VFPFAAQSIPLGAAFLSNIGRRFTEPSAAGGEECRDPEITEASPGCRHRPRYRREGFAKDGT